MQVTDPPVAAVLFFGVGVHEGRNAVAATVARDRVQAVGLAHEQGLV